MSVTSPRCSACHDGPVTGCGPARAGRCRPSIESRPCWPPSSSPRPGARPRQDQANAGSNSSSRPGTSTPCSGERQRGVRPSPRASPRRSARPDRRGGGPAWRPSNAMAKRMMPAASTTTLGAAPTSSCPPCPAARNSSTIVRSSRRADRPRRGRGCRTLHDAFGRCGPVRRWLDLLGSAEPRIFHRHSGTAVRRDPATFLGVVEGDRTISEELVHTVEGAAPLSQIVAAARGPT